MAIRNIDIVRKERNSMLDATDKFIVSDYPISDEEKSAWLTYRQALRDITDGNTVLDAENDFWPLPPRRYTLLDGMSSINLPSDYEDQYS